MLLSFNVTIGGFAVLDTETGNLSHSVYNIGISPSKCNWVCESLRFGYINNFLYFSGYCWHVQSVDFWGVDINGRNKGISVFANGNLLFEYFMIKHKRDIYNSLPKVEMTWKDFKRMALLN